jgi:hypothetical protein
MLRFDAASGAGGHCGGMGQLVWQTGVFAWIDDLLAAKA